MFTHCSRGYPFFINLNDSEKNAILVIQFASFYSNFSLQFAFHTRIVQNDKLNKSFAGKHKIDQVHLDIDELIVCSPKDGGNMSARLIEASSFGLEN